MNIIITVASVLICVAGLGWWWYAHKYFKLKHTSQKEFFNKVARMNPDVQFIVDNKFKIHELYNTNQADGVFDHKRGEDLSVNFTGDNYARFLAHINRLSVLNLICEEEYTISKGAITHYFLGRFACVGDQLYICIFKNIDAQKRTESITKQNEIILGSMLDNMPFPVMLKDAYHDLKYIYWNHQCDLLSGFSREEVLGKTDLEIYGPEQGKKFRAPDLAIMESGETYHAQEVFKTPDGVLHDTMVSKTVVSNDTQKWLLTIRWDVTEFVQTQRSLSLANTQLNLSFKAANITPWTWDIQTNIVTVGLEDFKRTNPGFTSDPNGINVDSMAQDIHPDDHDMFVDTLRKLRNNEIQQTTFIMRYDMNKKFENIYNISALIESYDQQGNPARIVGSMQNITAQKNFERDLIAANRKIEQINKTNEVILNNTDIGLVYLTPDFVVQWENVSKYSNHPIAQNYHRGEHCYRQIKGLDRPCPDCVVHKALASKQSESKEVLFGSTLVCITASPVFDSNEECFGVVLQVKDITMERQRETDLRTAKDNAEKSDKLKSAFLANMSHEIRTPLNAILGFSELLSMSDDANEKENYLQVISSNNDLLLQLINDILDLSKIEANTLEFVFTDVDVNGMMSELEQSFRYKSMGNKSLEIVFEKKLDGDSIYTDRNRLQQVISNFITNALKFTASGRIAFGCEGRANDVYFYVQDTGTGIPHEKQADIFKRFIKLDSFKTGTGLGLTICQTIVHKLNGEIGVESQVGVGSKFWFTIPRQAPSGLMLENQSNNAQSTLMPKESPAIHIAKTTPHSESTTILIAEDVVDNYELYKAILDNKFTLLHAWNGRQAVEMYREHHPSIILMDIKMPEMDGFQATAAIRKEDQSIPIVAVTAFAFDEDKKQMLDNGFNAFISKPIQKQKLLNVLHEMLGL